MDKNMHATLLRRMARSQEQEVAENPLTTSRAVRLVLTRAAQEAIGMAVSVTSIAEEVSSLDDALAELGDDLMLVQLDRGGQVIGLIALDMQFRAAIMEMRTRGGIHPKHAEDRAPTVTDKTLCEPLLEAFLGSCPTSFLGTPIEGWCDQVSVGSLISNPRLASLVLPDGKYRTLRIGIDLGGAGREGVLRLLLPVLEAPQLEEAKPPVDWRAAFQENVYDAPATLDALLHRFKISLAQADRLQIGVVLPLPGCSVSSVKLMTPDGHEVAEAKLGQSSGHRAVRLEVAPKPILNDLPSGEESLRQNQISDESINRVLASNVAVEHDVSLRRASNPASADPGVK